MDLDAQHHLKDCPFDGVCKYTLTCQLLVQYPWYLLLPSNGCCPEGRRQKWGDLARVRAWATVTAEPRKGMAELGQQNSQLMAALTQTGWGSSPTSAPGRPPECGHSGRGTSSHPNSCNGRDGPSQPPAHSLPTEHVIEVTGSCGSDWGNQGPSVREVKPVSEIYSLQCFRCQGWGHMAREWPMPVSALNQPGGTEGMWLAPPTSDTCPRQQ